MYKRHCQRFQLLSSPCSFNTKINDERFSFLTTALGKNLIILPTFQLDALYSPPQGTLLYIYYTKDKFILSPTCLLFRGSTVPTYHASFVYRVYSVSCTHHPPILMPVIVYSEPKSKATQLYAPAAGILQYVQGSSVKNLYVTSQFFLIASVSLNPYYRLEALCVCSAAFS